MFYKILERLYIFNLIVFNLLLQKTSKLSIQGLSIKFEEGVELE